MEDILPADIQRIFNGMDGAKETKIKAKNVLNMVLEQAVEDGLIPRNPLSSRSIRITGRASRPTEPYSVEQMRFLAQGIGRIEKAQDRAYMALQTLHPLRKLISEKSENACGTRCLKVFKRRKTDEFADKSAK